MLNFVKRHVHMGKLSSNIEHHGAEDKNAFDLPITEHEVSLEELNQLFDDPHAEHALYNTTRTQDIEPFLPIINPIKLHESYKAVCAFEIGGLEFTLQECKISNLALELQRGGVSKLSYTLRVRPEKDKQFLAFLGHQNRTIQLDVQEASVAEKGGRKQPSLFDGASDKQSGDIVPGPLDIGPQTEADIGRAQAAALDRSTPAKGKGSRGKGAH